MKKIKTNAWVTVTATGNGKFLTKGAKLKVHPIAAEKLIERGLATGIEAGKATEKPPKA